MISIANSEQDIKNKETKNHKGSKFEALLKKSFYVVKSPK
jgi:hypothetical protein